VAEKQVSCQRLGSNPLVNDQNAGPEEKIPFSTCRLGDFARGSTDIISANFPRNPPACQVKFKSSATAALKFPQSTEITPLLSIRYLNCLAT
jgi:hypothetical protein